MDREAALRGDVLVRSRITDLPCSAWELSARSTSEETTVDSSVGQDLLLISSRLVSLRRAQAIPLLTPLLPSSHNPSPSSS